MKKVFLIALLVCCSTAFASSDEATVEQSFKDFCKNWVQILKKNKPGNVFCKESSTGFIAEYATMGDDHNTTIKKTTNKKTPFVGILKYREKVFKCSAATRERAIAGPFRVASERNVTELFIYQNGQWQW
jgi:hypothetical protein